MNSSGGGFTKQATCPSSKTLLLYRWTKLSPEINELVTAHLADCDFCWAEVQLLAYQAPPLEGECRPPAMPVSLRIFAEALLRDGRQPRQIKPI